MQNKQRIAWLDMAKGYGMLLVIFSHISETFRGSSTTAIIPLVNWIYSFHLPLFFVMSGYVFSAKDDPFLFLKKKVKRILIPYLLLGLPMPITLMVNLYLCGTPLNFSLFVYAFGCFLYQKRRWTLWFLACLFCLNLLFYICVKVLKTNRRLLLASIIFPCLGLIYYRCFHGEGFPWNADVCLMAFPFFFSGYWWKQNQDRIDSFISGHRKKIIIALALIINLAFSALSLRVSGEWLEMYQNQYGLPLLVYPAAFAGVICAAAFSMQFTLKPVLYIGQNTLLYFAWHQSIAMPIFKYLIPKTFFLTRIPNEFLASILWVTIQLILIVASLTVVNHVILNSKLKFMLGK